VDRRGEEAYGADSSSPRGGNGVVCFLPKDNWEMGCCCSSCWEPRDASSCCKEVGDTLLDIRVRYVGSATAPFFIVVVTDDADGSKSGILVAYRLCL